MMGLSAPPWILLAGAALSACTQKAVPIASASAAASFDTRLGQSTSLGERTITPLLVLEDSRCPADVMCIQTGTARLLVRVQRGRKPADLTVGLDHPADVGGAWLHLGALCPYPLASRPVAPSDYRMVFALSDSPDLAAAPIACPAS